MNLGRIAVAAASVPLGVLAYQVQVDDLHSPHLNAAVQALTGCAFVLAGVVARARRPGNRLGLLMVVTGFALLLRQLRYSHDPLVFTTFFALGEVAYALVAHTALAYPSGRVTDRIERMFLAVAYATVLVFPIATLLFYDATRPLRFMGRTPRESLLLVSGNPDVVDVLQKTFVIVAFGFLASVFILLILRKLVVATPRARRILAPLLLAAIAAALRAVLECVLTFVTPAPHFFKDNLFWWQAAALLALPVALLGGLLRARLARAGVGELVLELERTPPGGLRDVLARALDDPTLEVAFWLPERRGFVDAAGAPVELPSDGGRAVTRLEHEGEPLAALVHDPSLLDEPQLIDAAGAAARLALENARLQAEIRAQLAQVQESRKRIVAAADEERRRLERDLHDGAQQRLVALALELRSAQRRLGEDADPEVDRLLAGAVEQLQGAVEELRELARGVHPAILSEDGLAAALESLVARTPFPLSLDAVEARCSPQVEATAYFVACESLANVIKHADASRASIHVDVREGMLAVEVSDDGAGGARATDGSGLRGLEDRVEALGGRLTIESPPGGGTRIRGEIPCAS